MHLILDQSPAVAAWVAARIPQMAGAADFGPATAIGVVAEDGRALGGVVFHNYQPRFRNIEVSFASETPHWLTRNLIRQILAYPFDQLACQRLTAITPKKAHAARAFLDHFGFKREGVLRRGFGTDDAIISGMLKREWMQSRWARPYIGRRRSKPGGVYFPEQSAAFSLSERDRLAIDNKTMDAPNLEAGDTVTWSRPNGEVARLQVLRTLVTPRLRR